MITGTTQLYGIIGHPVYHTCSPSMHNAAFQSLEIDAVYLPFSVTPEHLASAMEALRSLQIQGVNVTIPHKTKVIPFLDELELPALFTGAVNTIRNDQGRLIGTNTDGEGFIRALHAAGYSSRNKRVLLLGAGGSSRAILASLAKEGTDAIFLFNRTLEKAEQLVCDFQSHFPTVSIQTIHESVLQTLSIDWIINTTSVGMNGTDLPISFPISLLSLTLVVDIIYHPPVTPLLQQASAQGISILNGQGMLLHQGVAAFEFWTQQPAPVAIMAQALCRCIGN